MNIKNEVLYRVYGVLVAMVLAAVFIFSKAVRTVILEGDKWRSKGDSLYVDTRPVDAQRGNILATDGSLLATSLPFFEIRMDLKSTGMSDEDFNKNIDSLAWCLATYVDKSYTPGGMKFYLQQQRELGNRYLLLARNVSYAEKERIRNFPLFNLGKYRGGLILVEKSERKRPFGLLAHRTIGYVREGAFPVGLEGYFDEYLTGKQGQQAMIRVAPETWIPIHDLKEIEPQDGYDLRTTLDVNMQDIAENALLHGLQYHQAENGCAIVMEVKTGAIRAMANLGKTPDGYWETYNFAVGAATEPGSTMKLASIMALLEDGYVKLSDSVNLEKGATMFFEEEMRDATYHLIDSTSVQHAFEMSSNVGIAKLVWKSYGEKKRADKFIRRLEDFNLNKITGIEVEGEPDPYIKEAYSAEHNWSGTTLPWMSTGYEVTMTPLQMLSFYNAVANDGVQMKPYLVEEVQQFGQTIENFRPVALRRRLASKRTIEKAQELLAGVVERGTASNLKSGSYSFAGKTGTAQLNYQRLKSRTNVGGYQSSFVGYFPAENPVYSCIVLVTDPQRNGIYGSEVAGPIFREIADKMFSSRPELQVAITDVKIASLENVQMPDFSVGKLEELRQVMDFLDMKYYYNKTSEPWSIIRAENDSLKLKSRVVREKTIPSVVGMGLKDALFILENLGLRVEVSGVGKVARQSILPGTAARGQRLKLFLS